MKIKAKLFGVPEIYVNDQKVKFSYSKIEGFIYYLLIEKTVSRSEMAGLLWPEDSEKTAKKNLRNVLYHTRKNIDKDFVLTPNNTILQLNEDMDISIDLEDYLKDPDGNSALYQGEFLQGFNLRDSEEYERWVHNKRAQYLDSFYKNLQDKARRGLENQGLVDIEGDLQRLIDLDNLDEENYRLLMTYYLQNNRLKKIVELYSDLSIILKRELGVEPGKDLRQLYDLALDKINKDAKKEEEPYNYYFGREKELARIHSLIASFMEGGKTRALYVEGEAGLGKSALVERAYRDFSQDFEIFSIPCYEFEEERILSSLKLVLLALRDGDLIKDSLYEEGLKKISSIQSGYQNKKPLEKDLQDLEDYFSLVFETLRDVNFRIFNFEDVHWIDEYSARILTSLILKDRSKTLYFFTARSRDPIESMLLTLDKYGLLEIITLRPLSFEDGKKYVKKVMDEDFKESTYEKIYSESQGNPLFMAVFTGQAVDGKEIGIFNDRLSRAIKSRFTSFDQEEKSLLDLLSFFKGPFPLEIIFNLTDLDRAKVVDLLDQLESRSILEELEEDGLIYFSFKHKKIKDFIYLGSTKAKRKYYHKVIGDLLEKSPGAYKNKLMYLEELVYHFTQGEDQVKEVQYRIEILNHYLDYSHELFPVLDHIKDQREAKVYLESSLMDQKFSDLKEKLDQVEKIGHPDLDKLKMKFFYMRGRFLIRDGKYQAGLEDIRYVITKAKVLDDIDYMINGYKQLIYYKIQVNQAENMLAYIEEGLKLSVKSNYHKEIGMFLRFKGLYYLMKGNYREAESLLRESINTFTVTEKIAEEYAINIAAAHSYIGEIYLATKDYKRAQKEFSKAIEISSASGAKSSLSIFYINMGKSFYFLEDYGLAKVYLDQAQRLYEDFDFYWKRPVLYSYLALLAFENGDYEETKRLMVLAMDEKKKMDDPRARGTIDFVLYTLEKHCPEKDKAKYFSAFLTEDLATYRNRALIFLDPYRDTFERERVLND